MSPTANITKVHEILLTLEDKKYVVLHTPNNLELGDTVHFHTNIAGASLEIYFKLLNGSPGSPFLNDDLSPKTEVDSNDPPLPLKVRGEFAAVCSITSNGVTYGYDPSARVGGGDMIVR